MRYQYITESSTVLTSSRRDPFTALPFGVEHLLGCRLILALESCSDKRTARWVSPLVSDAFGWAGDSSQTQRISSYKAYLNVFFLYWRQVYLHRTGRKLMRLGGGGGGAARIMKWWSVVHRIHGRQSWHTWSRTCFPAFLPEAWASIPL